MTTTVTPESPAVKPKAKANRVRDKIKEQVIALLGKPKDLWRVDVHLHSAGIARVNVWRTVKIKPKGGFLSALDESDLIRRTEITDSYYLRLSKSAVIESANPTIKRRY